MGAPQRGVIHSAFNAAANIVFPGGFILSLNAASRTQQSEGERCISRMPNGLELSCVAGTFPFTELRAGMQVLFGAQRLHIEAIGCSLDLSLCSQWNPHIEHPDVLDMQVVRKNRERLASYISVEADLLEPSLNRTADQRPAGYDSVVRSAARNVFRPADQTADCVLGCASAGRLGMYSALGTTFLNGSAGQRPAGYDCVVRPAARNVIWPLRFSHMRDIAQSLCGRGVGLTPAGDDILAGWIAAGWLLYGPMPDFVDACRQIVEIARCQTHLLSQCWLSYASEGNVAQPICALLDALTQDDEGQLGVALEAVLAMGATSGHDLVKGMLLMLNEV